MSARALALRAFVVKEVWHLLRDRQTLSILLLLPLAQVVLFGYALRNDIEEVRIAFIDPAPDYASQELRARFAGNPRFRVVATAPVVGEVEPLFRRGAADVALVFPADFGRSLRSVEPAPLLLIGDAADPNTGASMAAYAGAVIDDFEADLGRGQTGVEIRPQVRMRFNPTLESVNLFVPGLIALVLTMVSALMTAISLSREKERGTMEILLVSPLRPWQIITGKVLPYLILAFANAVTALLAAWLIFRVPFRGSVLLLLSASVLYALVGLALGVVIAALTASQRAAMVAALAGTMLPNALLSGMIFPIASLPDWLRVATNVVPARWFIVIARGVMLKGVGIDYLWRELLVLSVMLAVLMLAAVRAFRPRLSG